MCNCLNVKLSALLVVLALSGAANCSKLFISKDKMSWTNAKKHCIDNGGGLVEIWDAEKTNEVNKFVDEFESKNPSYREHYWIGEPNDKDSPEKCVELKGPRGNRGWNDWECDIRSTWAICEKTTEGP